MRVAGSALQRLSCLGARDSYRDTSVRCDESSLEKRYLYSIVHLKLCICVAVLFQPHYRCKAWCEQKLQFCNSSSVIRDQGSKGNFVTAEQTTKRAV